MSAATSDRELLMGGVVGLLRVAMWVHGRPRRTCGSS